MNRTIVPGAMAGMIALLALSGCAVQPEQGGAPEDSERRGPNAEQALTLTTSDTDLGEIVVDEAGMTVYVFDEDEPNSEASACDASCLETWPAVTTADDPAGEGIDGELGTFTRDDGSEQVTLDGQPLYYYSGDSAAGDVNGQAVQGIWWVVGPDGEKITDESGPDDSGDSLNY